MTKLRATPMPGTQLISVRHKDGTVSLHEVTNLVLLEHATPLCRFADRWFGLYSTMAMGN